MALTLLALGAIGHAVLWIALINRVHALGIARRWVNIVTVVCVAMLVIAPLGIVATWLLQTEPQSSLARPATTISWTYICLCAGVSIVATMDRLYWAVRARGAATLLTDHTTHLCLKDKSASLTSPGMVAWLANLPGNEVLNVSVHEKELAIPRLAKAHDGLRIVHLTDLHMSGRLTREYYDHIVDEVNRTEPDIVAITGDIVEGDKFCDWIPPTLGRLQSRYGAFYVLGNHDRRATESCVKKSLADAGVTHVGGSWRQIMADISPLVLAGNELPWFKPAADMTDCPVAGPAGRPTRILLAHSPDQFNWAIANDFDLMLAGHLHGGQVRVPLLGAVTSPSMYGVRHAAGVFRSGSTVLHVSRGTGGLTPIRYNCPPEIAVLVLRPSSAAGG